MEYRRTATARLQQSVGLTEMLTNVVDYLTVDVAELPSHVTALA